MLGIRTSKGMTLIEMLVVFFIVSILTLLALPSLLTYNQEERTIMYAQNLYYAFQYARTQAVKTNSSVYVNFQTGNNWCYGINVGSTCNCSIANNCGLQTVTTPSTSDMALTATGLPVSNSVVFEPTHGAAGVKSTITLTPSVSPISMSVEVPIMGSAVMCSTTISGFPACP